MSGELPGDSYGFLIGVPDGEDFASVLRKELGDGFEESAMIPEEAFYISLLETFARALHRNGVNALVRHK